LPGLAQAAKIGGDSSKARVNKKPAGSSSPSKVSPRASVRRRGLDEDFRLPL
jgi:hypothetical protein